MKYILVNGFKLSKKTPAGRNDMAFEEHSLARLEEIIELTKRHKAKLIFTSPWLGTVSDTAAFKAVALLKTIGKPLAVNYEHMGKTVSDALSIEPLTGRYLEKGIDVLPHRLGVRIRSDNQSACVLYSQLPMAIGINELSAKAGVTLVSIGKVGRSKDSKCEIETIALSDDSVFCKAPVDKAKKSTFLKDQGNSEFVERLKANLAKAQSSSSERTICDLVDRTAESMDLSDDENFSTYVKSLFDEKYQIRI